jgi:pimeloyl-ACP methyl ester carboxylesterase
MTAPLLPPPLTERDRAIVLVHGAWLGEWSWSPVLPFLRTSGRPVINVSLTGHGARRHQSGPHITLADHADDIVNAIESADAVGITLVAHSYGGRPATEAAGRIAERLRSIVYVDAHAPLAPNTAATADRRALADENGGMLPYTGYDPDPDLLGGDAAVTWYLERIVHQSYATFEEPLTADLPEVDKTYVFCTENVPTVFATYAAAARAAADWHYVELAAPHMVMFSHPDALAAIILDA